MAKYIRSISVIVPVFNEWGNIQQFHTEVVASLLKAKKSFEIIYVDDYSSDGTYEWLLTVADNTSVKVFRKSGVKGKAFSLIQGFNQASGDALVMIDGDLQYPPEKIPQMVTIPIDSILSVDSGQTICYLTK